MEAGTIAGLAGVLIWTEPRASRRWRASIATRWGSLRDPRGATSSTSTGAACGSASACTTASKGQPRSAAHHDQLDGRGHRGRARTPDWWRGRRLHPAARAGGLGRLGGELRRSRRQHAPAHAAPVARATIRAHLLRWRPRPHAQRTGSTPRVRPSGAALQLDPSRRSGPATIRAHLCPEGGSAPFRNLPPRNRCAGKAGARTSNTPAWSSTRLGQARVITRSADVSGPLRAWAVPAQSIRGRSRRGQVPLPGGTGPFSSLWPGAPIDAPRTADRHLGVHCGLPVKSPSPTPIWYARKSPKPRLRSPDATPR